MEIEPISQIDFSRTLCKYYGFELYSAKKNGKTKRIFRENITPTKTEQIHAVQALSYYAANEQTKEDFLGQRNVDAYEDYIDWCRKNVQPIVSKIGFSRTVCAVYDIQMKTVKDDGRTTRVFCLKEGVNHGDDSPGQESLG